MKRIQFTNYWRIGIIVLVLTFVLGVTPASTADDGAKLAEQFLKKIPLTSYDQDMTMDQAMKIQAQFVEGLKPTFGEIVGYKAGLTNLCCYS